MKSKTNSTNIRAIIIGLAIVLTGIAGVLLYQNKTVIIDWFAGLSYSATAEVSAIEQSIDLNDSGRLIFRATKPVLSSRDEFNDSCDSHNTDVSVLGCYTKNRIYVYDVDTAELSGVKESTMAHELLHAVWDRLSTSDKDALTNKLLAVYNDEKYHALLSEDLETYAESERIDELHSRIGTEIANLPADLESHYAKYFKDQDRIVSYYDSYITPFRTLSEHLEALSVELESLKATIEQKTSDYYASAESLSAEIDEFNNCANTPNCFATDYAFYVRRNELSAIRDTLEAEYESISSLINQYNNLVKEYNENIVRGRTLESMINSNTNVESIK
ncbi:hypothetical protein IKF94_01905 [Candidatus Saccharibacteria bacterium]|nr:hypothetical protein [Candidatus Saccharibacteria bacterium]